MAARVRWSRRAVADLEEIAEYIAEDAPGAARRFVERVRQASRSLRRFPGRGRRVPELQPSELRELLLGDYRLIYRIGSEAVEVVTLVHGARDLSRLRERPTPGETP